MATYYRDGLRYEYPEVHKDGWPLCPRCGEDELYSLDIPATVESIRGCYNCEFSPQSADEYAALNLNRLSQ
jgi:hypothetical protein